MRRAGEGGEGSGRRVGERGGGGGGEGINMEWQGGIAGRVCGSGSWRARGQQAKEGGRG